MIHFTSPSPLDGGVPPSEPLPVGEGVALLSCVLIAFIIVFQSGRKILMGVF